MSRDDIYKRVNLDRTLSGTHPNEVATVLQKLLDGGYLSATYFNGEFRYRLGNKRFD